MLNFIWLIILIAVVSIVLLFTKKKNNDKGNEKKPKPGDKFNSMMSRKLSEEEINEFISYGESEEAKFDGIDSDYADGVALSALEGDGEALDEIHERLD